MNPETGQEQVVKLLANSSPSDDWLFGWDKLPGVVSVWANRQGRALVWQRTKAGVRCLEDRFRPWLFAANLLDLKELGSKLVNAAEDRTGTAPFTYQELAGPTDTLRYLLSAQDGQTLRRIILKAAQKRLGLEISTFRQLGADYYSVGSVEQYLMVSGRVYFGEMAYSDLHRLQFDLETTGLSPQKSRIFMVAVRDSQGLETVLEAPTEADEGRLITKLCQLIRERDPDVIENHNIFGFDLPFLERRAAMLGVPLHLGRKDGLRALERYEAPPSYGRGRQTRYTIPGRELIDTLDAVRRHDFSVRDMSGHGLKAAARYFGLASPDRTYLPGSEVFATYQHNPEQVRQYALDDVREVDGLSQRLMGAAFALAGMAPRSYERLASAGPATGVLEPLMVRAYRRAGVGLPRNAAGADAALAPHQGGATILYSAGVARQVVKADIASMYPSIMRTFQIGPSCDSLKVLLYLVSRLTDLRLEHKREAARAESQSAAAHQHNALQAAMKIVVNSAYGYMAAGQMALFADRKAADEVTRLGREILGKVVDRLRERGLVLLEADTDGVFFGVPESWTENHERECVRDIAATLPKGLKLEYEGRYQAMLSHEVKNYALLSYDGQLILRGNSFHSSRSESFGEDFLKVALRCTLLGNIVGVYQAYLDTVASLRQRRFSLSQVAREVRLMKSHEDYADSRKRRREAPYEALLIAGRTNWRVGERIRFYRAADGREIWLPNVAESEFSRSGDSHPTETKIGVLPKYDVEHYLNVFQTTYVSRLKKAFAPEDFEQLFRLSGQAGLFDQPIANVQPLWIRAE